MPGRRPLPTAIKELNGNPGKRPLNQNEPKPRQKRPKPPAHLSEIARAEWRRVVRMLSPMGVITEVEADMLAVYVQSYARWVDASGQLAESGMVVLDGRGNPVINPYLRIVNECIKQMHTCMVELGMTPASRARLSAPAAAEDGLELFLQGR
jgi:P27 family predicted phage terminase small subunit